MDFIQGFIMMMVGLLIGSVAALIGGTIIAAKWYNSQSNRRVRQMAKVFVDVNRMVKEYSEI